MSRAHVQYTRPLSVENLLTFENLLGLDGLDGLDGQAPRPWRAGCARSSWKTTCAIASASPPLRTRV